MPGLLGTSLNADDILETLRGIGRGLNFGGTSGMIGAPVDMATAVLNNPGLLHPGLLGVQGLGIKDPVGGSKWIEQKLQNQGLFHNDKAIGRKAWASLPVPLSTR